MKNDISWATDKKSERDREVASERAEGKQGAGKGDSPRHNLSKYDEGYDGIRWKSQK